MEPPPVVSLPRRKGPIVLASAVTVALVISGAAFAGYRILFGSVDPAERVPSSAIAFVSADLSPNAQQTRALERLRDPKETIRRFDAETGGGLSEWAGPTFGAAFWSGSDDKPFLLVVASSRDNEKARAWLDKLKSKQDIGYVLRDGAALIAASAAGRANAQGAAESADAQAQRSPLSHHNKYLDARKRLDREQLAVFYADLARVDQIIESEIADLAKETVGDKALPAKREAPTGVLIAGLRAEEDGLSLRFRNLGAKATAEGVPEAMAKLGALPASADIAAVARIRGDIAIAATFLPLLLGDLSAWDTTMPGQGPLTEAEFAEFDALMSKPPNKLTAAERKRLEELMKKLTREPEEEVVDVWGKLSTAIEGATVSVSVSGIAAKPTALARFDLTKELDSALRKELARSGEVTVDASGRAVTITSGKPSQGTATLGEDQTFKRAFAGVSGEIQLAFYANLDRVLPASLRSDLGPVKAIGVWLGVEEGEPAGGARILIG